MSFSFPSPEDGWEFWERTNPPLLALKSMLAPERYQQLRVEGGSLMHEMNTATDRGLVLASQYLLVIAQRPLARR